MSAAPRETAAGCSRSVGSMTWDLVRVRRRAPCGPTARAELLAVLARTSSAAEALRKRHPDRVTFVLGTEISVTTAGMVPGPGVFFRPQILIRWGQIGRAHV